MHAQEQRRLRPDRALVVGGAGAVRRADLDEPRAGAGEHLRDPEAVADLDQLAARDEHLAALGERREREQDGGGVVVDDERGLGAGQAAQDRGRVHLARAARAGVEVVLEVRPAAADLEHALERLGRERRPAEVRVHDHAGRVEDAAQPRAARGGELLAQPRRQIAGLAARPDLLARPLEHRAGRVDRERVVGRARELVDRRKVSEAHGSKSRAVPS